MPNNSLSVPSALAAILIIMGGAVEPLGKAQDITLNPGPVYARFPFRPESGSILVPVSYNGKEYPFCLDTGSTHTVFDTSLLLGEPYETISVDSPSGLQKIRTYSRPKATLGGHGLRGHDRIGGIDLLNLRKVSGSQFLGLLGFDALDGLVVQFNFDSGEVLFLHEVGAGAGAAFPLSVQDGYPYLHARLAGQEHRFMIDTGDSGFGSGSLAKAVFDQLANEGLGSVVGEVNSETIGGTHLNRIGRFKDLSLGEFQVVGPLFTESSQSSLGLNFWSRFVVTFDFRNKQVFLRRGKEFGRADFRDRSGMRLLLDGGKVVAHSVRDGSAASKAGVMDGDELYTLGAKRATEMGLQPVRRVLCEPGATVEMVLRRNGNEIKAKLYVPKEEAK